MLGFLDINYRTHKHIATSYTYGSVFIQVGAQNVKRLVVLLFCGPIKDYKVNEYRLMNNDVESRDGERTG